MDVNDSIVLILSLWAVVAFLFVASVDVYVTLLLIGVLVVLEVGGSFIKPEAKQGLKSVIYFLLFIFGVIVVKKILEVLR